MIDLSSHLWTYTDNHAADNNNIVVYEGDSYIVDLENNTVKLKSGAIKQSVIISKTINFNDRILSITEICSKAYDNIEGIEEIRISGDSLIIGDYAFKRCHSVKYLRINGRVLKIGRGSFLGCEKLETVEIEGDIDLIDSNAFAYCTNLKKFSFNCNVTTLCPGIFRGCKSLGRIILPNGISQIPNRLFYECVSLREVILPESVETIGDYAFLDCESLQKVIYNEEVELGNGCFYRTPLDSSWGDTHPITTLQQIMYSDLDVVKSNLQSGRVISRYRSIYDANGLIVRGDDLFNVIRDFMDGTSIHFKISESLSKELEYQDYNYRVYFFPIGNTYQRVVGRNAQSAHFIRMIDGGNPLNKKYRRLLQEEGIPQCFLDDPSLWMRYYLHQNPDIPEIVAEALKGIGFSINSETIRNLAEEMIKTDETWSNYSKNRWDNNFLCRIVNCLNDLYKWIDVLYKSRERITGKEFYDKSAESYIYLYNMIRYQILSNKVINNQEKYLTLP